MSLNSKMVSQRHAEIIERKDRLYLHDAGSTNGTFVNGKRLAGEHHSLADGDILHFAQLEYRLVKNIETEQSLGGVTTNIRELPSTIKERPGIGTEYYQELREILHDNALRALFQPLVSFKDGSLLGYEALGHSSPPGCPMSFDELFRTAEAIGLAVELSVKLRNQGLLEAKELPDPPKVFLNTHLSEFKNHQALFASLEPLRVKKPPFDVVLEIHEAAITDIVLLRDLRRELDELGVSIAFTDFGTGQVRLLELAGAAPHYLRFDAKLIRGIDRKSKSKQSGLLGSLVKLLLDLKIEAIAEGVDTFGEAEECRHLGVQYGQGDLFGKPSPPITFVHEHSSTGTVDLITETTAFSQEDVKKLRRQD